MNKKNKIVPYVALFVVLILICAVLELSGYIALKKLNDNDHLKAFLPNRIIRLKKVLERNNTDKTRYVGAINLNFMPTPNYELGGSCSIVKMDIAVNV